MSGEGVTDKTFEITPRQLYQVVGGLVGALTALYLAMFANFLTIEKFDEYVDVHTSETNIENLLSSERFTEQLIWDLEGEGLTPEQKQSRNKQRLDVLKKRQKREEKAFECLQAKGKHCLDHLK